MQHIDNAKSRFAATKLRIADFSQTQINRLIEITNQKMRDKEVMKNNLFCCLKYGSNGDLKITCDSHYFENREAYTFYTNGELSIAYWADGLISKYFAEAFEAWLDEIAPIPQAV